MKLDPPLLVMVEWEDTRVVDDDTWTHRAGAKAAAPEVFQQTMLGFHHGHLKKKDDLPLLFAAQFPVIWGATTKRVVHTGHMHHMDEKEHAGITVHQHPTLAARDAYAARGGWVAGRRVTALTYHAEFGEVARTTATPDMIRNG